MNTERVQKYYVPLTLTSFQEENNFIPYEAQPKIVDLVGTVRLDTSNNFVSWHYLQSQHTIIFTSMYEVHWQSGLHQSLFSLSMQSHHNVCFWQQIFFEEPTH